MDSEEAERDDRRVIGGLLVYAARLIQDEPNAESLREAINDGLFAPPSNAMANDDLQKGFSYMALWLDGYQSADSQERDELVGSLQREWLRLFAGAGAPDVPSWSNFYLDTGHGILGPQTIAVRDAYREFGLEVSNANREPDDALGLMLRFCAHMAGLQLAAEQAQDHGEAQRLKDMQRRFLSAHILPWIARWRYEGLRHASSDYYRGSVLLAFGALCLYAGSLDISYNPVAGSFLAQKSAR